MMKKKVLGLALMAMALIGFNGMAQNTTQSQKAQVENNACCKKGDKDSKKGGKMQAREKKNPYEGLTLTDAQKTKLAQLDAKRQAERQAKMEARKAQKDGRKGDLKNMTDAEKQAAKKAKMDARKADKMEYLKEVKAIIGPDQYVVFLENMYVNGGQQGGGKAIKQGRNGGQKGMAHNKGGKGQRKGGDRKGGQRGQKPANSANAQS